MSGTLFEAAATATLLSSKQEFHCSVCVWHQSPLCVAAAVESSLNALAEKQPSMGLKYCLL